MGKYILVTGGAGLIGTRLCARLRDDGHQVISLDNYFAGTRDNHVDGVEYREGHTKDIETHIPETPELIFHLGEYARVEQSVLEPEVVYDLNTKGTKGVVEFWKKRRCKLVYAGSSTKFGNEEWSVTRNPYAATKAENTELVKRIGDAEGLPYAITYFYNVYGPGERAGVYGTVVEAYRQMYLAGAPLAVTTPGTQERNFTHLDDIVDGLILVAEKGQGDEYGLGAERKFSILALAKMFGGDIVMLPPREGNRMSSALDTSKARALGWAPTRSLEDYIASFIQENQRPDAREKRVLVFCTTFFPTMGPAEEALLALARKMPDVTFDVVTTAFSAHAHTTGNPEQNVVVHRSGFGIPWDKFLLPLFGVGVALSLHKKHRYAFAWSVMASYPALAGLLLKRASALPLLITLADQRLDAMSSAARALFRTAVKEADQVYGIDAGQEAAAERIANHTLARTSLGVGDAFANQLRYAYVDILRTKEV